MDTQRSIFDIFLWAKVWGAIFAINYWRKAISTRMRALARSNAIYIYIYTHTPQFSLQNNLDGQTRQSSMGSVERTQATLAGHSSAPRGMNTTETNANRMIRIAAQRTQDL